MGATSSRKLTGFDREGASARTEAESPSSVMMAEKITKTQSGIVEMSASVVEQKFVARQHGPVEILDGLPACLGHRLRIAEAGRRVSERLKHSFALGCREKSSQRRKEQLVEDCGVREPHLDRLSHS